ncbi:hypothetical protein AAC387_Pa02g1444 [Persea americana]
MPPMIFPRPSALDYVFRQTINNGVAPTRKREIEEARVFHRSIAADLRVLQSDLFFAPFSIPDPCGNSNRFSDPLSHDLLITDFGSV